MLDLDRLEELAKAATPGPWVAEYEEADDWFCVTGTGYFDGGNWMVCPHVATVESGGQADAAFIAAARAAIPELIERVRALEAAVASAHIAAIDAAPAGLTERQAAAWPGAVAEAQRYVPCSTIPVDIDHYEWRVTWADETRPGRGRMIDATWCDGEYLVQVRMDVYGYPSVSVAETRWLHSGSYEECDCTWCEREREDEYQ